MSTLRTDSHKPKLPRDSSYCVSASELEMALDPHLTGDLFLSIQFHPHQPGRKNERDRFEALGEYRLLDCRYADDRAHLAKEESEGAAWAGDPDAQVVTADVFAVPTSALIKGVGMHGPVDALLAEALAALASQGIPSARSSWSLELGLDARVHTLRARLRPSHRAAEPISRTLERVLPPVGERRRV
jgi:hypothetical protein